MYCCTSSTYLILISVLHPMPPRRSIYAGQVSGSVVSMDFTADGGFVMLNSSGMDMAIANAETCNKASPKDMKALRYRMTLRSRVRTCCSPPMDVPRNVWTLLSGCH